MPRTLAGEVWEQGLRSQIRAKTGFTVSEARGKALLRYRPKDGKAESCLLPVAWTKDDSGKILLLVNRMAQLLATGEQGTLKGALAAAQDSSTTMRRELDWAAVKEALRKVRMDGANQLNANTWKYNYGQYIDHAIGLIESGAASDGYTLLQLTLERWEGKPDARTACCGALRQLTEVAVTRHGAARSWQITKLDTQELKGKRGPKKVKATLTDAEILGMITSLEQRNPQWANVLRLMATFGLRPIELQYISAKQRHDGSLGLWCAYEKVCGSSSTAPRWIEPCHLRDAFGEPQQWNLIEQLSAGLLDLPKGRNGKPRKLDGKSVNRYLGDMAEWKALDEQCAARGEWLRPYAFRDSYSLRCHQLHIESGAIARSMGHSLAVHSKSYRWASNESTAAAFAGAQ